MTYSVLANREGFNMSVDIKNNPVPSYYINRVICVKANFYHYFVSTEGIVYDVNTNLEVPIWKSSKTKYCHVSLEIEGKRKIKKVHRLVALLYIPNPDPKNLDEINHKDGNKDNNSVDNLEWSNSYLNNKHARETGLNNISKSNSLRWKNEGFSKRARKNMSKKAIERNMYGNRNPNFKYTLVLDKNTYTIQEMSLLLSVTYSLLYRKIREAIEGGFNYIKIKDLIIYIIKG